VEDQAIAFVVVDHRTAFMGVVVGAFHDPATTGLNNLRRIDSSRSSVDKTIIRTSCSLNGASRG
jgi:hypothetical protein